MANHIEEVANMLASQNEVANMQLLSLVKAMFDPRVDFKVAVGETNGNTVVQRQAGWGSLTTVTNRAIGVMIRGGWGVSNIQAMVQIPEGTLATLTNFAAPQGTPAWLQYTKEDFIQDLGNGIQVSPNMPEDFTIGRNNSFRVTIQSDATSGTSNFITGSIATADLSDIRGPAGFAASELAIQSVSPKDGLIGVKAQEGVTMIQGPRFSQLEPVSQQLSTGKGDAASAANVLSTPLAFNNSDPQLFTYNGAGANYSETMYPIGDLTNMFSGMAYLSHQTKFSSDQGDLLRNVSIGHIGYQSAPIISITAKFPSQSGRYSFATLQNPTAQAAAEYITNNSGDSSWASVHVVHVYLSANGTTLTSHYEQDSFGISQGQGTKIVSQFKIDAMVKADGTTSAAGPFIGCMAESTFVSRAPLLPNKQWVGAFVWGQDSTTYLYKGTDIEPAGNRINYLNVPWWGIENNGAPTHDAHIFPWFRLDDTVSRVQTFAPSITGIQVEVPKLYDDGFLNQTQFARIDNLGADQTLTVKGTFQSEVVTTGSTAQFKKPGNESLVITYPAVKQVASMMWGAPDSPMAVNYRRLDYEALADKILAMKNIDELLQFEAFRSRAFLEQLHAAGLFGKLWSGAKSLAKQALPSAAEFVAQRALGGVLPAGLVKGVVSSAIGESAGRMLTKKRNYGSGEMVGMFGAVEGGSAGMFGNSGGSYIEELLSSDDDDDVEAAGPFGARRDMHGDIVGVKDESSYPIGTVGGQLISAAKAKSLWKNWRYAGVIPLSIEKYGGAIPTQEINVGNYTVSVPNLDAFASALFEVNQWAVSAGEDVELLDAASVTPVLIKSQQQLVNFLGDLITKDNYAVQRTGSIRNQGETSLLAQEKAIAAFSNLGETGFPLVDYITKFGEPKKLKRDKLVFIGLAGMRLKQVETTLDNGDSYRFLVPTAYNREAIASKKELAYLKGKRTQSRRRTLGMGRPVTARRVTEAPRYLEPEEAAEELPDDDEITMHAEIEEELTQPGRILTAAQQRLTRTQRRAQARRARSELARVQQATRVGLGGPRGSALPPLMEVERVPVGGVVAAGNYGNYGSSSYL